MVFETPDFRMPDKKPHEKNKGQSGITRLNAHFLDRQILQMLGVEFPTFKLFLMPLDKNLLTLRAENLDDLFDQTPITEQRRGDESYRRMRQVDLENLAIELFNLANNDATLAHRIQSMEFEMLELSISGN